MDVMSGEKVARIRYLNDLLRCQGIGGQVMVTAGIDALGPEAVLRIVRAVANFTDFNQNNDPHGERDCAKLSVGELSILFKIDYFDRTLTVHSSDPADPTLTSRVLTMMLAEEY